MKYFVYELSDPAEADIPVYVSWGPAPTPWDTLWNRQMGLEPGVSAWFNQLRNRGCVPVLLSRVGAPTMKGAKALTRFRLEQLVKMVGGFPDWLLNDPWWDIASGRKPVIRELSGEIFRYASVRAASKATGSQRHDIGRWCRSGVKGPDGSTWWFDR